MADSIRPGYLWRRPACVLNVVERLQRREPSPALATIGMPTPQYAELSMLTDHPGILNGALALRSFVTAQTMTDILRALHQDGRVTRTPHVDHPVSAHRRGGAAAGARRCRDHGD